MEKTITALREREIPFAEGVSAERLTTFGSGGRVRCVISPRSVKELRFALKVLSDRRVPSRVIGGGSNVLLPDQGYNGALLSLACFDLLQARGCEVSVGSGVKMPLFAARMAQTGLCGAEFLCGIPGVMGGGVITNAGAFGGMLSDLLTEVTFLSAEGEVVRLPASCLTFGYHSAVLPRGATVLSMKMRLAQGDSASIKARMREMMNKRLSSQPHERSAGSVFRKTGNTSAAIYIEQTGLKGKRIGGALLSAKHCNFIVNEGSATTQEYYALAELVRERVAALCGVRLDYEVERICSPTKS